MHYFIGLDHSIMHDHTRSTPETPLDHSSRRRWLGSRVAVAVVALVAMLGGGLAAAAPAQADPAVTVTVSLYGTTVPLPQPYPVGVNLQLNASGTGFPANALLKIEFCSLAFVGADGMCTVSYPPINPPLSLGFRSDANGNFSISTDLFTFSNLSSGNPGGSCPASASVSDSCASRILIQGVQGAPETVVSSTPVSFVSSMVTPITFGQPTLAAAMTAAKNACLPLMFCQTRITQVVIAGETRFDYTAPTQTLVALAPALITEQNVAGSASSYYNYWINKSAGTIRPYFAIQLPLGCVVTDEVLGVADIPTNTITATAPFDHSRGGVVGITKKSNFADVREGDGDIGRCGQLRYVATTGSTF